MTSKLETAISAPPSRGPTAVPRFDQKTRRLYFRFGFSSAPFL
jgi:hypothetical protein